jgi:putative zinc finger/helix-turn-helix YgiT family protein
MNTPKPNVTLADQKCPVCHKGKFELVQIDHIEEIAEDNPVTIRNIWVDRCNHCGETVFPGDTTYFIESVVAEQTEQLTPHELERIREDLGNLTQDEMSEVLGLGTKSYHKWESGAQFPTRSMCYYIRVLAEFPQAFEWLRCRAWRNKNRLQPQAQSDFKTMYPDLAQIKSRTTTLAEHSDKKRINPACGLRRVIFVHK